ncbi:MAG TPA: lamin tail domain-containing protein [Methanothrix sp.]|nr:lamin tail domain-containing protein [Methanothrix sp.]
MKYSIFVLIALLASALVFGLAAAQEDVTPDDIMAEEDVTMNITGLSYADEDEWVEVANPGNASRDFTYWTLEDENNNTFSFTDGFVLAPGAVVKVHTGQGNDTVTDLYWGRDDFVWDDGEVATLKDAGGEIVAQYPESS